MKYFQELEFQNWELSARKIWNWLKWDGRILKTKFFWNTVDHNVISRIIAPELGKGLDALGLKLQYAAIVTAYSENSEIPHVNNMSFEQGVVCRLNLPIKNTEGSYTVFYEPIDEPLTKHMMPDGSTGWLANRALCREAARVQMLKPTIIRVGTPHAVFINKGIPEPRITLTMRLNPDPVKFLDENL